MSSPIDKFLKELSSEAAAKAKPSQPRGHVDAVMSDSGLFDVHALVSPSKKPAGPAVDTSKSKPPAPAADTGKSRPPALDPSKSKPPAASSVPSKYSAKSPSAGDGAVMSDSGLFDVRELVTDLKAKRPAAGGNSMTTPAALGGGKIPTGAPAAKKPAVQDFELFDFRDGAGGDKKPASKSATGRVPTPAPPPKTPQPSDDDGQIMSDSGLFDVRELVAEVNKRPTTKPKPAGKAEAPTELGVSPIRGPEPVRQVAKPRTDGPSKVGGVRPVGKPLAPADTPSRMGIKTVTVDTPSKMGIKPVSAKPPAALSGRIPAVAAKSVNTPTAKNPAVAPGARSGKAPPVSGKIGMKPGGRTGAPPKKGSIDLDDIVSHRDDPNTTAEERMDRREASKAGKTYTPPVADDSGESASNLPTLILLLLVVLAGGAGAYYYFFVLQN